MEDKCITGSERNNPVDLIITIHNLQHQLSLFKGDMSKTTLRYIYSQLGHSYELMGDNNEAIRNFERCRSLGMGGSDDAIALYDIGRNYLFLNNLQKAIFPLHRSHKYFKKSDKEMTNLEAEVFSGVLLYRGLIHFLEDDHKEAEEFIQKSLKIRKDIGNNKLISEAIACLVHIYKKVDKPQQVGENLTDLIRYDKTGILTILVGRSGMSKRREILSKEKITTDGIQLATFQFIYQYLQRNFRKNADLGSFEEINLLTMKLKEYAEDNASSLLLCETYMVQSAQSMFTEDYDTALKYIEKAKKIAIDEDLFIISSINRQEAILKEEIVDNDKISLHSIIDDIKDLEKLVLGYDLTKSNLIKIRLQNLLEISNTLSVGMNKYKDLLIFTLQRIEMREKNHLILQQLVDESYVYERGSVDIRTLVGKALLKLNKRAYNRGVSFDYQPPEGEFTCFLDQQLVTQIVENIIGNAVVHCTQGSVIDITITRETQPINAVIFRIKNEGQRIPAKMLEGRNYLNHKKKGLAFVFKAIEKLRSSIEIKSPVIDNQGGEVIIKFSSY